MTHSYAHAYGDCSCYHPRRVDDAESLVRDLRQHIERWHAQTCTDPLDHSQTHNALGGGEGHCAKCHMSWPCPSAVMLEWVPTEESEESR